MSTTYLTYSPTQSPKKYNAKKDLRIAKKNKYRNNAAGVFKVFKSHGKGNQRGKDEAKRTSSRVRNIRFAP
jgi:hypothetical protein